MTVIEESLGFGLLVGQKKLSEDVSLVSNKFKTASHFNCENKQQMNRLYENMHQHPVLKVESWCAITEYDGESLSTSLVESWIVFLRDLPL